MCYSAMGPLNIVGAWIVAGRREQEPGLHLVQHTGTVTTQVTYIYSLAKAHLQSLISKRVIAYSKTIKAINNFD